MVNLTRPLSLVNPHMPSKGRHPGRQADSSLFLHAAVPWGWNRSGWYGIGPSSRVQRAMRRNRRPRREHISSSRTTTLRTVAAWIPAHSRRIRRASSPTASVCCPTWPRPRGTAGNRVVGPDRRRRPASSAWQTPPTGVDSRVQSCAQSDSLDFSRY